MKKKQLLPILIGVFLVLMVGAYGLYTWLGQSIQPEASVPQKSQQPGEKEDTWTQQIPAPDFTVYDAEGNPVKLSDYIGKPMVLNFWASWCGPCKMEMPHFDKVYQEMGEDIYFVMVNMTTGRETQQSAQALIDDEGYTFPILFDTTGDAATVYGAYSLPMSVFIDANGNIQDLAIGAIDEATLLSKIGSIQ